MCQAGQADMQAPWLGPAAARLVASALSWGKSFRETSPHPSPDTWRNHWNASAFHGMDKKHPRRKIKERHLWNRNKSKGNKMMSKSMNTVSR